MKQDINEVMAKVKAKVETVLADPGYGKVEITIQDGKVTYIHKSDTEKL